MEKYAPYAMEEQIKTGIPSSVTLAQMALESGWGRDSLGNNCFGIKATPGWKGARVINPKDNQVYRDYPSVEEGISDHSRIIQGYKEYGYFSKFPSYDYHNWIVGIKRAGYASDPDYIDKIESIIKSNGLSGYDHAAIAVARQNNIEIGSGIGLSDGTSQRIFYLNHEPGNFSMPLEVNDKGIVVTGRFGEDRGNHTHKGLDISTHHANLPVLATEDNGRVISVKPNNGNAGNSVTIEYDRGGQPAYRVTYMHLDTFSVRAGQTVSAGQQVGLSGSTGHSTGEHLHLQVDTFDRSSGKWVLYNPVKYLSEIAVRGGQPNAELRDRKGENVLGRDERLMALAPRQDAQDVGVGTMMTQDNLLASLSSTDDPLKMLYTYMQQGDGADDGQGMLSGLVSQIFKSAMAVGIQLMASEAMSGMTEEDKQKEEQEEQEAAKTKIDGNEDIIHRDYPQVDSKELAAKTSLAFDEQVSRQDEQQRQQDYQLKG